MYKSVIPTFLVQGCPKMFWIKVEYKHTISNKFCLSFNHSVMGKQWARTKTRLYVQKYYTPPHTHTHTHTHLQHLSLCLCLISLILCNKILYNIYDVCSTYQPPKTHPPIWPTTRYVVILLIWPLNLSGCVCNIQVICKNLKTLLQ